jgi:hypothetical protein
MFKFAAIPSWLSCIFYALVCIYVGATRSLIFYNVKEESKTIKNDENQLMTLKNAISIPVIATLSLLLIYFSLINQLNIVNQIV